VAFYKKEDTHGALEERLGLRFRDPDLLQRAFIHSSHLNENAPGSLESNERLEFLGDAVLGQAIALLLYQGLPASAEGELTRLRAALVRRETLAELAQSLDLGNYLLLGRGEEASGGRRRPANLANALEALIGAAYLDQGEEAAQAMIERLFTPRIERLLAGQHLQDAKSRLQEALQGRHKVAPVYRVVEETGPSHDRRFTVEVMLGDAPLAQGTGQSKRAAEQEAAHAALARIDQEPPTAGPT
jgi:ribonuclease-3